MAIARSDNLGKLISSYVQNSACCGVNDLYRAFEEAGLETDQLPRAKTAAKALKDAVKELEGEKFQYPYEGKYYEADILAKPVSEWYNLDLRLKNEDRHETFFIKTAQVYIDEHGIVQVQWENGSRSKLPQSVVASVDRLGERMIWGMEHHNNRAIRSLIDQTFKRFTSIKVKAAVYFLPEGDDNIPMLEAMDTALSNCVIGGRVNFTIFTLANDPKTKESLKTEIIAAFEEKAEMINERVTQAQTVAARMRNAVSREDQEILSNEIAGILLDIESRVNRITEEVELVEGIFPDLDEEVSVGNISFDDEGNIAVPVDQTSRKRIIVDADGTIRFE